MSRPPSKIVFVGNIPYGLSEEQISDIFSGAGRVVSFRLVYDRENGKPKGFGFAEYPDADSAASAVRNLNDYEVMGRKLRVDFSNEGGDDDYVPPSSIGAGLTALPQPPAAMAGVGMGIGSTSVSASGSGSLPPLPPGRDIPPGAVATDEISRVLRTLPPSQLLDILSQMKTLAVGDPARATELLAQAPQLAYAGRQALLLMDLVSPEAIKSVALEGGGHPNVAGVAGVGVAGAAAAGIPAGMAAGFGMPAAYPQPGYYGGDGGVMAASVTPAAPPVAAAPPPPVAAAPAAQNPDDLIQQVLALPQAVIDQLPEAERTQLMALRMQYGGGAR